jgi:8-amino-7-oxononanoate synthase
MKCGICSKNQEENKAMSKAVLNFLENQIAGQRNSGLIRNLKTGFEGSIDFASNDYLGLARSIELFEQINEEVLSTAKRNGSTGSRLLTGNSSYTEQTENFLAEIFQAESALIFNSGYSANLSVLSSIPQKDDTIIYDEHSHASIKDGARLSLAKRFAFRHNNLDDLELKIKKSTGRVYIIVESIYSMDGDECPLEDLCDLAEKYDACIVLDEAHSTGVMGENGNGMAIERNLHKKVFVRIYTFGKAMGIHGAVVVGTNSLRDYLINFARPFIYTTALSPHSIASVRCAFNYVTLNKNLQINLKHNIEKFLSATVQIKNRTPSKSAIQTLIVPGNDNVRIVAKYLNEKGFDVRPILSPTVPKGLERLRISLHAFNSTSEIEKFTSLLSNLPVVVNSDL